MPELSVSDAQRERLEEISDELESVYVGEYGTVRVTDAIQYLLDTYTPPEADSDGDAASEADVEALTAIDGVGEATAETLIDRGFPSVERVAAADPESIAEIDGVGSKQAVDIVASATAIASDESGANDGETDGPGADDPTEGTEDEAEPADEEEAEDEPPENTLQQAMSLLETHDDRWRESSGEEPYEVDLPDGSTEAVRTKDDIKRLIFKHWR
jgi:predicted flap endonuclease-1-like 5' DNA nuclease